MRKEKSRRMINRKRKMRRRRKKRRRWRMGIETPKDFPRRQRLALVNVRSLYARNHRVSTSTL